jgi:predicted transcriptional regulator/DNA-binding XRE family transcriptional regulator
MSIDPIIFGQRLRHYRKRRGYTLEQLGSLIGRPAPYLSLVENGKREPKLSQINSMAEALGVSVTELLEAEPPNRRARLEIALERAQSEPRYEELGLPYLKASARLPDEAIEHIVALYEQLTGREEGEAASTDEIRSANGEVTRILRKVDGYLQHVEEAAIDALKAAGYSGPGPLTGRHVTDLIGSLGYRVRFVDDIPTSVRSVVDPDRKRIYLPQRNELRTRQARKALLQTAGSMMLGHSAPRSAKELLTQRLETAYFAAAVLIPEPSAVEFLRGAHQERDLSIEDVKEQFYVSYEMAAQRFTNLVTRHFAIPTHFIRSDADGTIWKSYANDGLPLPADAEGGSEGQLLCRKWGARAAFSSSDKFAIHHQFTDTPAGSFWCATHIAADLSGHAFTVGVRFEDARLFRGRRTNTHVQSTCPAASCCSRTDAAGIGLGTRAQHRLVAMLAPGLPTVESSSVTEFLERHADDIDPAESLGTG